MKSRPSPASSTASTFRRTALAAALSGLFALPATPALAGTITVANGGCTLTDAINSANTGGGFGTCTGGTAGADTIVLPANSTQALTAVNNVTEEANGLPSITSAITIQGNGSTITRQAGSPEFRIFRIAAEGDLSLQQTTISGGRAIYGGGILNRGTVSLTNSVLSGNTAFATGTTAGDTGGGLHNAGQYHSAIITRATLTNSTVSGNTSSGDGGGIYSRAAEVTLTKSTVSGNTANMGAGLLQQAGGLQLDDSTVSGNQGYAAVGLFLTRSTVGIHNSTISGNTAFAQAAGIYMTDSTVAIERSLVSGNISSNNFYAEIFATDNTLTLSRNLFGHSGQTSNQSFYGFSPGATDINATSDGNTGILMPTALTSIRGPLANNGGPTLTHALVTGSPALDAVPTSDAGCTGTDQRGTARPQGTSCDIGAFERVPPVVAAAGTCGTADGVATSSAPAMNLCGVGTLTATVMGSAGA
ncbi:MAG: choice-of-anchor Q domain-containing protein, partial [Panacagrimonas sp.]